MNIDYWYHPHAIKALLCLREAVERTEDPDMRRFFQVAFSVAARRSSLADPRLSVPVRLKQNQYPRGHWLRRKTNSLLRSLSTADVVAIFQTVVEANSRRMENLNNSLPSRILGAAVIGSDARDLRDDVGFLSSRRARLPSNSVRLAITSPPYLGAQKYIRASSLSLAWLGLADVTRLRDMERKNIGREHFTTQEMGSFTEQPPDAARRLIERIRGKNPLRAHIAARYLSEMSWAIAEIARVLKPGGHLVLISADNQVCGQAFPTVRLLQGLAEGHGLSARVRLLDTIHSRGLMTRRNSTAAVISREAVTLFEKR